MQHKKSQAKFTKRFHGNLYMEYLEEFQHRGKKEARHISHKRELKIKKFSHKRKQQLINIHRNRSNAMMEKTIRR